MHKTLQAADHGQEPATVPMETMECMDVDVPATQVEDCIHASICFLCGYFIHVSGPGALLHICIYIYTHVYI